MAAEQAASAGAAPSTEGNGTDSDDVYSKTIRSITVAAASRDDDTPDSGPVQTTDTD